MDVSEYPSCCAIGVISNLGYDYSPDNHDPEYDGPLPKLTKELKASMTQELAEAEADVADDRTVAQVTINQYQEKYWGPVLRARRFKEIASFKSSSTGNKIYVFQKKVV